MVTSQQALKKYGEPEREQAMTVWDVPANLEIGVIPKKIYCNRDMIEPLTRAFLNLIQRGVVGELRTWDGCFNNRPKRGYEKQYERLIKAGKLEKAADLLSLHSWGIAIDVNAAWNGLGKQPTLSPGFVKCFTDAGFDWGGLWQRKDGMHFQLSKI